MGPAGAGGQEQIASTLERLAQAKGEGDGLERRDVGGEPQRWPAQSEPEPEASVVARPETEPEPEPETVPTDIARVEARLAAAEARNEGLQREMQFLRIQPQDPADPVGDVTRQALEALKVPEDAVAQAFAEGTPVARTAAYLTQLMQNLFLVNRQVGGSISQQQVTEAVQRAMQPYQVARSGDQLANAFWGANEDLQPYQEIVEQAATQVAREQPQHGWNAQQTLQELSRRTRATLQRYGITPESEQEDKKRPTSIKSRRRPAIAEMGGGGGHAPEQTDVQKMLGRIAGR